VVHHGDPVGKRHHLVQFGRHNEHRHPLVAFGDDLLVHKLDRTDVKPASGLRRYEEFELPRQLASKDNLLLVSTGQRTRGGLRRGGTNVELGDLVLSVRFDSLHVDVAVRRERRLVNEVEYQVVLDRERGDHAVYGAVFRYEPDTRVQCALDGASQHFLAVEGDGP